MVETLFIPAKYTGVVELSSSLLAYCKKYKTIALFAAIQFTHTSEHIKKTLINHGITVINSQSSRTDTKYQTLGCLVHYDNLKLPSKPDAFLYIGDGLFHPSALVLSQRDTHSFIPVIIFDPKTCEHKTLDQNYATKIWKKYRGSLLKYLEAKTVGILISTKFGQFQYTLAKAIVQKYPDKKFYYFVESSFSYQALTDFPFVDMWINTACPRIGLDDAVYLEKPVINGDDALIALEILSKDSLLTKA